MSELSKGFLDKVPLGELGTFHQTMVVEYIDILKVFFYYTDKRVDLKFLYRHLTALGLNRV